MGKLISTLTAAQGAFERRFPGTSGARQPVHVVYGGAHLFKADTVKKLGAIARQSMTAYAPDALSLGEALGLSSALATRVFPRVVEKLEREPIEDLRIDFEDGYGHRTDAEEDGHARAAGAAWKTAEAVGSLPAFCGVRIKPLSTELAKRALDTLSLFLEAAQPRRSVLVTLPKVVTVTQVKVLAEALMELESLHHLAPGALRMELMIESAQGLLDPEGRSLLPQFHAAAQGRLHAAHFGAYDFTASLDIAANEQRLHHPSCDVARNWMKLAFSETEVFLSDGATTQMPVAPHRGVMLSAQQQEENRRAVHAAWSASAQDIRRSLSHGFYQGWDLHPAQLVARYGTLYAFFLENLEPMTERLSNFVSTLGQATLSGTTFDDAATGQGLLHFFLRGKACGALTDAEVAATGLTPVELQTRSFATIARNRR